ncbi:hypothetical protein GCM10010185_37970 [Saccharothrix coeruleofusca]|uniref:Uncharacterized protein n=1 Tax=Saccharothrix coeruleofusca TaxID=33919 RepID=A0A918ANJ9_9PSEU|nr:hypothetical protein GCM10010185_37970 [Saccharothrix coeruleofusca]
MTIQYGSSVAPRSALVSGLAGPNPEFSLSTTVTATAAAVAAVRMTWSLPASWVIGSRPMPARSNASSASTPSRTVSAVVVGGVASSASSRSCSSRNSWPRERGSAPSRWSARTAWRSAGSSSQMIRTCSPHAASSASATHGGGTSSSPES